MRSQVLPLQVDIAKDKALSKAQIDALVGLQIASAQTAIRSLGSLAKIGEVDHLGGGLELIPSLLLTLAVTDYEAVDTQSSTPTQAWDTTRPCQHWALSTKKP